MKYIDVHGHINFPKEYDNDREEVVKRAKEADVGIVTVGVDLESSRQAVALAEKYENNWAIIGIHPVDTASVVAEAEFVGITELVKHPKVVAIGECGLDYFHSKPEDLSRQRELFLRHIQLANDVQKPLMLHIRNGKPNSDNDSKIADVNNSAGDDLDKKIEVIRHNAYQESIGMLKEYAKVRANFHFFAGTIQDAQDIVAMGNMMSFTGVITFARNYDEIIKNVPIINIMSETDCPYVAPIPYRGKRCEPVYVIETIKKIAEIRGESFDIVSEQLIENAKKFLGL